MLWEVQKVMLIYITMYIMVLLAGVCVGGCIDSRDGLTTDNKYVCRRGHVEIKKNKWRNFIVRYITGYVGN